MNLYDRLKEIEGKKGYKILSMDYGEGNFLMFIDDNTKTVNIEYPTIAGIAYINMGINEQKEHVYEIGIGQTVRKRITNKKGLERLGSTKRETLHQDLHNGIQESKLIPDIPGNYDKAVEWLLNTIHYQMSLTDVKVTYDEYTRVWYAQVLHDNKETFFIEEDYDEETQRIAKEVLLTNNVLNTFLRVMKLRVVGQHSQLLLKFLAALSSALSTPLNTIAIGDSSSGKTWTEDTVYDLFPEHRKIKLDADTTHNSILRMTYFQEGKFFFKRRWVYLGDLGDADEWKRASELMSVMKVLMSEQQYRKGVAEKDQETGEIKANILELVGCGSVSMQLVTSNIENQFGNRTVFWSPLDTQKSRDAIREYQEDVIASDLKRHMYKKQRKALACAIDNIFKFVEHYEKEGSTFKIYNPFLSLMGEKYNISQSPNVNRDRMMMNMIPSLVTLANCYNRDVYYNDDINQYVQVVTPKDFQYTTENMSNVLSSFLERRAMSLYKYIELLNEHILPKVAMYHRYTRKQLTNDLDEKESLLEDIQEFTLADLRKYTNISDNTIREKMNALVELGLLVKDERRRTHTYMVPSEFDEDVKSIFPDQEKNDGEADTGSQSTLKSSAKSTELLRPDPTIENLYTDFISELLGSGFVKTSTELLRLEPDITGE